MPGVPKLLASELRQGVTVWVTWGTSTNGVLWCMAER
jgi:hypothetical protein